MCEFAPIAVHFPREHSQAGWTGVSWAVRLGVEPGRCPARSDGGWAVLGRSGAGEEAGVHRDGDLWPSIYIGRERRGACANPVELGG